ncbi:unnamed protein product, partial [Medioppia subpectinata]
MAVQLRHLYPINSLLKRALPVLHKCCQKRCLNLQEYQSKQLMRNNGVRVQRFCVIESVDEIKSIIGDPNVKYAECPSADGPQSSVDHLVQHSLADVEEYVIKAQVLAGGRGKGYFKNSSMKGGVQLTKDKQKVTEICAKMLNDFLITA